MKDRLDNTARLIFLVRIKLDRPKEVLLFGVENIDNKSDFIAKPDSFLIDQRIR